MDLLAEKVIICISSQTESGVKHMLKKSIKIIVLLIVIVFGSILIASFIADGDEFGTDNTNTEETSYINPRKITNKPKLNKKIYFDDSFSQTVVTKTEDGEYVSEYFDNEDEYTQYIKENKDIIIEETAATIEDFPSEEIDNVVYKEDNLFAFHVDDASEANVDVSVFSYSPNYNINPLDAKKDFVNPSTVYSVSPYFVGTVAVDLKKFKDTEADEVKVYGATYGSISTDDWEELESTVNEDNIMFFYMNSQGKPYDLYFVKDYDKSDATKKYNESILSMDRAEIGDDLSSVLNAVADKVGKSNGSLGSIYQSISANDKEIPIDDDKINYIYRVSCRRVWYGMWRPVVYTTNDTPEMRECIQEDYTKLTSTIPFGYGRKMKVIKVNKPIYKLIVNHYKKTSRPYSEVDDVNYLKTFDYRNTSDEDWVAQYYCYGLNVEKEEEDSDEGYARPGKSTQMILKCDAPKKFNPLVDTLNTLNYGDSNHEGHCAGLSYYYSYLYTYGHIPASVPGRYNIGDDPKNATLLDRGLDDFKNKDDSKFKEMICAAHEYENTDQFKSIMYYASRSVITHNQVINIINELRNNNVVHMSFLAYGADTGDTPIGNHEVLIYDYQNTVRTDTDGKAWHEYNFFVYDTNLHYEKKKFFSKEPKEAIFTITFPFYSFEDEDADKVCPIYSYSPFGNDYGFDSDKIYGATTLIKTGKDNSKVILMPQNPCFWTVEHKIIFDNMEESINEEESFIQAEPRAFIRINWKSLNLNTNYNIMPTFLKDEETDEIIIDPSTGEEIVTFDVNNASKEEVLACIKQYYMKRGKEIPEEFETEEFMTFSEYHQKYKDKNSEQSIKPE